MSTSNIVLSAPAKGNGFAKYSFSTLFKPTDNIAGEVCYLQLNFVGVQRNTGYSMFPQSLAAKHLDPLSTYAISISFNQPVSYSSVNSGTGSTTISPASSNFLSFANQNSRIIGLISTGGTTYNSNWSQNSGTSNILTSYPRNFNTGSLQWGKNDLVTSHDVTAPNTFTDGDFGNLVTVSEANATILSGSSTAQGDYWYTMSAYIKRITGTGSIKFIYSTTNSTQTSEDLSASLTTDDYKLVSWDFFSNNTIPISYSQYPIRNLTVSPWATTIGTSAFTAASADLGSGTCTVFTPGASGGIVGTVTTLVSDTTSWKFSMWIKRTTVTANALTVTPLGGSAVATTPTQNVWTQITGSTTNGTSVPTLSITGISGDIWHLDRVKFQNSSGVDFVLGAGLKFGTAGDQFHIWYTSMILQKLNATAPLSSYNDNQFTTSFPSCLVNIPMTQEEVTVSLSKLNSDPANLPSYSDNLEQLSVSFTLTPSNTQSTIPR